MSWSAEAFITTKQGEESKIQIVADYPQAEHGADESRAAIAAAREAAFKLAETGVLGGGKFRIGLNGHSNPGNKPSAGWVNDNVQINISQIE